MRWDATCRPEHRPGPVSLKAYLDRYTALQVRTYGEPVDAMTRIPHMPEAFIARDRGFRRGKKAGS